MKQPDLVVVGAGAAGLLAAGLAAKGGLSVMVLEKMNQAGRKLSITGKGRCNITNDAEKEFFIEQIQPHGQFLYSGFNDFYNEELISLFDRIGIKTKLERGGRYFPEDNSAPNVTKKLIAWCEKNGVTFRTGFKVNRIITRNGSVVGIQGEQKHKSSQEIESILSDRILLCTGGYSYPATGSDGDGHKMLRDLGHQIADCMPSLVPLEIDNSLLYKLKGLDLRNVEVTALNLGKKVAKEFGELSFIDNALSGPIILKISRLIVPLLKQGGGIKLKIDFKPGLDHEKLDKRLIRDLTDRGNEPMRSILRGLMPAKLVSVCLDSVGIAGNTLGAELEAKERSKIRKFLKEFTIRINGHRPFSEAIITKGGVITSEVDQKTMESKLVKGLYIAGELLDLDGPTGGYNLQIAFTTAHAAAMAVQKSNAG